MVVLRRANWERWRPLRIVDGGNQYRTGRCSLVVRLCRSSCSRWLILSRGRPSVAVVPRLLAIVTVVGVAAVSAHIGLGASLLLGRAQPQPSGPRLAEPLRIEGSASEALVPGRTAALDVVVGNPNGYAVRVTSLSASVDDRTSRVGCSAAVNFRAKGLLGSVLVPARTAKTLSALGVPAGLMPSVTLLNLPVNQDACKGALLSIAYVASAHRL